MNKWDAVVDSIIRFIKETLPGLLAAFSFGKSIGNKKINKLESKLAETELQLEYKKNEAEIEKNYSNKSDHDVIESIIKRTNDQK